MFCSLYFNDVMLGVLYLLRVPCAAEICPIVAVDNAPIICFHYPLAIQCQYSYGRPFIDDLPII